MRVHTPRQHATLVSMLRRFAGWALLVMGASGFIPKTVAMDVMAQALDQTSEVLRGREVRH